MNEDKPPATASESKAGETMRHAAQRNVIEQAGERPTAKRTVGVYERPAQRTRLSLPLLLIMILAALVSVVATARFLF